MKKWTIYLTTLLVAIAALCILTFFATRVHAVYTVKFIVDEKQQSNFSEHYGADIQFPEMENPDEDGNVFIGWFTSRDYDDWFNSTKVTKNVTVYGYWLPYEQSLVDITFYDDDGEPIEGYPTQVQIGDCVESYDLPDTPDGYRLDKWLVDGKPFDFGTRVLTSLEFYPTRKPALYTVEYISLDKVISTQYYTVENCKIKEPACPEHEHYYPGVWEDYEVTVGDLQIHAIYEPIPYTVNYVDGSGDILASIDYTILTYKDVVPPEPTPVPGCYSYFDELKCGVTEIRQKVKLIDYVIEYYARDELVERIETNVVNLYKYETPEIKLQILGYEASWESFKLGLDEYIRVNAIYTPIVYNINFVADNRVVEIKEYTVENTLVDIPETPEKAGYTCEWEDFTAVIGDITVNALFTPIDYTASFILYDEVIGTEYALEYTATFNAEYMTIDLPDTTDYPVLAGCDVNWKVPDKLQYGDILINGYYYDSDYYYLNFVQVIIYADDEDEDEVETVEYDEDSEESDEDNEDEEEKVRIILDRYFYIGRSLNANGQTKVVIPNTYHGYRVEYIEEYALSNCNFTSLEINGVEIIGDFAFCNCTSMESAILHDGVKIIGKSAFTNCESMKSIQLPETITQISDGAFSRSGLVTVTLPESLDVIAPSLFANCFNLAKITIPKNVKEISNYAFSNCISLTVVNLGSVEVIGSYAFEKCTLLREIVIPESVYHLESYAFSGCSILSAIKIIGDGKGWYFYRNNDLSTKQALLESIVLSSGDLANSVTSTPSIGFYKEH